MMHWKLLLLVFALGFDQGMSHWFFNSWSSQEWFIQSQLVLILLIYWQLHERSDRNVVLGLFVGWIQDIFSDQLLLGVHALSFALILMIIRSDSFLWLPEDPVRWLIVCELGIVANGFIMYAIHWMFKQTTLTVGWTLIHQTIPNLLVHLLGIGLFIGIRHLLQFLFPDNRFGMKS